MKKVWYVLLISTLVFVFLYAWYLPANNARQLVLDLPANGTSKQIVISNDVKIEQVVTLAHDANAIILPLESGIYPGSGIIHLRILKNQDVVTTQEKAIASNQHGEIAFEFFSTPMLADTAYTVEISFSNIASNAHIRIATAFGKYANLSGIVNQYVLQDSVWKLTDIRHGNIALSFYNNPPNNHVFAALKIFVLPGFVLIVLGLWSIRILGRMNPLETVEARLHWREYVSVAAIGIFLAAITTAPLFIHPSYISNHGDINRGLIYNAIAQRDILMGHLPQWNQYICGGVPVVGDLESWFLHPLFFLTLPFPAVVAMKLMYMLVLASAFIGFYIFARIILKFQIKGSSLFAVIMAFGGYLSAHLAEGYYVWVASAYVPWFLLFAMLALKNSRFIPLAGLMLAFMFGTGSMHLVVYSILFIALVWLFPVSQRKFSERVALFFVITAFFVVVSAVKLLPAFSILTASSSREGFAPFIQMIPKILFGRGLLEPVVSAGQTMRWGEFDGYIGVITGILAVVGGIIFRKHVWRQYKVFLIASAVMGIISFMPLPIMHGFISHITDLFRMPSRVLLFAIFGIALVAGVIVDSFSSSRPVSRDPERRRFRIKSGMTIWIIILLVAIDLISNDMTLFSRTFTVPIPELHAETKFQGVSHAYTSRDETYYRTIYLDFLENRGTNDVCRFYQAGPFTRAIDETDPRYISRGEVYLQDSSAGTISYIMNNKGEYVIHAEITSPTTILVNQNYYPGWVTNSGRIVENKNGIISVSLIPGVQDIMVDYRPNTVYWGICISMISVILGVLLLSYE